MLQLHSALAGFAAVAALAAADQTNYDACYDPGSACDVYIAQDLCDINTEDPDQYWSCYCNDYVPVKLMCDECAYEWNIEKTYDASYETSICSKYSQAIGTVPESLLETISEHMATITIEQTRTLDTGTITTPTATATGGSSGLDTDNPLYSSFYNTWESTNGGQTITTAAPTEGTTVPASVGDEGSNPANTDAGNGIRPLGLGVVAGVAVGVVVMLF